MESKWEKIKPNPNEQVQCSLSEKTETTESDWGVEQKFEKTYGHTIFRPCRQNSVTTMTGWGDINIPSSWYCKGGSHRVSALLKPIRDYGLLLK